MLNEAAYLIGHQPRIALVAFVLGIVLAGLMVWSFEADRPRREAENAAWWKAKLECRQAGGSFEYFGTQGYHCVGGRQK